MSAFVSSMHLTTTSYITDIVKPPSWKVSYTTLPGRGFNSKKCTSLYQTNFNFLYHTIQKLCLFLIQYRHSFQKISILNIVPVLDLDIQESMRRSMRAQGRPFLLRQWDAAAVSPQISAAPAQLRAYDTSEQRHRSTSKITFISVKISEMSLDNEFRLFYCCVRFAKREYISF